MSMLLVIAGLIVVGVVISRLTEFLAIALWVAGALVAVALLATVGGAVFGWGGAVAVVGGAAHFYFRPGRPLPPATGRYGYGPGDIMPPSPKGPDGRPF